ncbi:MAG: PD40 domain-containing protein [Armatimonadetes bacterium]|nr:PD40 domain-containing protein [Armatimonadota bacterium]
MKPCVVLKLSVLVAVGLNLAGCGYVAFSPDGKSLAFSWRKGKADEIAMIDLESGKFTDLPNSGEATYLQFASSGQRIAYQSLEGELMLYDLRAGRVTKVADSAELFTWAEEDRRLVAFERRLDENYDCVWFDVPTRRESARLNLPEGVKPTLPPVAIGYNGSIGIVGDKDGKAEVYIAEFGKVSKLTTTGDVVGLAASRDGREIIWARRSRNAKYILLSLYRYDMQMRSVRKMDFPEHVSALNPGARSRIKEVVAVVFSPDWNRMIVAARFEPAKKGASLIQRLFSVSIDGRQAREIASDRGGKDYNMPAFSWDSRKIAMLSMGDEFSKVILSDADGSNRRVLRSLKSD